MTQRLVLLLIIAAVTGVAAARAESGNTPELPTSNLNTPAGHFTPLKTGVTYQASSFPLALRVTPQDGTWGGAQWTATSHGKPAFGWTAVGRPPLDDPRGVITIETAFGPTPSVSAAIARLRTGGSHLPDSHVGGVTFGESRPAKVAGYSGRQFDGQVWGRFGKVLIPFSAQTHGASPPDSFRLEQGEAFRVIALDVKGKTVVLFLDSWKLPPQQFPAFVTSAQPILETLRFHV